MIFYIFQTQKFISEFWRNRVFANEKVSRTLLFFFGVLLILDGLVLQNPSIAFAQSSVAALYKVDPTVWMWGVCNIYQLLEGAYGALLTTIAGIAMVIAASAGQYKLAYTLVTVGVSCFILRAVISIFFGNPPCDQINSEFLNLLKSGGGTTTFWMLSL